MVGRRGTSKMLSIPFDQRRREGCVTLQDRTRSHLKTVSKADNQLARKNVDRTVDNGNRVCLAELLQLRIVRALPPASIFDRLSQRQGLVPQRSGCVINDFGKRAGPHSFDCPGRNQNHHHRQQNRQSAPTLRCVKHRQKCVPLARPVFFGTGWFDH